MDSETGPGAHPASCKMGIGSFRGVKCGRGVLLTTHPLLVPRSTKSRAIPLPTLWTTLGLQREHFTFTYGWCETELCSLHGTFFGVLYAWRWRLVKPKRVAFNRPIQKRALFDGCCSSVPISVSTLSPASLGSILTGWRWVAGVRLGKWTWHVNLVVCDSEVCIGVSHCTYVTLNATQFVYVNQIR